MGGVFLESIRTERLPPKLSELENGFAFYQFGMMALG